MKIADWMIDYFFTLIAALFGQISIMKYYESMDKLDNITAKMITNYSQLSEHPVMHNALEEHLDIIHPQWKRKSKHEKLPDKDTSDYF